MEALRRSPSGRPRCRKAASRLAAMATTAVQVTLIFQCRDGHRLSPIALACLTSASTWTWDLWRASSQATCPTVAFTAISLVSAAAGLLPVAGSLGVLRMKGLVPGDDAKAGDLLRPLRQVQQAGDVGYP